MGPIEVEKQGEKFTITEMNASDVEQLRPVLERWIQWDGEVLEDELNETMQRMATSVEFGQRSLFHYIVVRTSDGNAIGCAGVGRMDSRMRKYTTEVDNRNTRAGEMINVFLSEDYQKRGLGRELFKAVQVKAMEVGYNELVWNSGPRYKEAWDFYRSIVGEPIEEAKHYYGAGWHAQVWRVSLP